MPFCPTCGTGVDEGDRFCVSCGSSLGGGPPVQAVPSVFLGPYELVGVIGRGATGTVYLATDTESGQKVVLKVLDPVLAGIPGYPERLRAESVVLSQLADPHLVATYGVGQDQGHLFLIMEYVEGASLRAVEQRAGRLTPEQALGLVAGALVGLGLAHAHGLVHGDVKPENIVVDTTGTSKLVDFGQVVSTGGTTLGGTPSYMSPEAARGQPVEARSDLYSMGVVLYEALAATLPFNATSDLALLRMQAEESPPPIPGLPDQVAALLNRTLAKDPGDRPQSAGVFLAELETAAASVYGHDWKKRAAVAVLAASAATLVEDVAQSTPAGAAQPPSPSGPSPQAGAGKTVKAATAHTAKGGVIASHPILATLTAVVVVAGLAVGGVVVAKGNGGKLTAAGTTAPTTSPTVPMSAAQLLSVLTPLVCRQPSPGVALTCYVSRIDLSNVDPSYYLVDTDLYGGDFGPYPGGDGAATLAEKSQGRWKLVLGPGSADCTTKCANPVLTPIWNGPWTVVYMARSGSTAPANTTTTTSPIVPEFLECVYGSPDIPLRHQGRP